MSEKINTAIVSMRKLIILTGLLSFISLGAWAQEAKVEEKKGKPIIQVFGNFNTGIDDKNNNLGFELERSYLGYEYNLGKGLSIKSVMDIGKSSDVTDNNRLAYVKNAMITWKKGNMTLNGGLISTIQFNFQEKFWGYRYIMSSFQDYYKFGSSADLGVSVAYKFTDWISADAIVVNGEGYKKLQKKDGLNYGAGITLTPAEGFQIRVYGAINQRAEDWQENIANLATFAGYKNERFSIGAEYNIMANASYTEGANQDGFSIYGTVKAGKITEFYARFDNLHSKDNWNIAKDGYTAMVGAQFKLGKYVKLAPNFRTHNPKASALENTYGGYISFYFGL